MPANKHVVQYGASNIPYEVSYARRISLGIKVMPDGTVKVVAPLQAGTAEIQRAIHSRAAWILKQQLFFRRYKPSMPKRKYVSGETHLYLGRQYTLKIVKSQVEDIHRYRGALVIKTTLTAPNHVQQLLEKWYRARAEEKFALLLEECLTKFKRYKIGSPSLYIRHMQQRWGSCTSRGKIILNTELIKAPRPCIEYVIIHELCHLVHRNHTKEFFMLQHRIFPDWEKWKDKLEMMLA